MCIRTDCTVGRGVQEGYMKIYVVIIIANTCSFLQLAVIFVFVCLFLSQGTVRFSEGSRVTDKVNLLQYQLGGCVCVWHE